MYNSLNAKRIAETRPTEEIRQKVAEVNECMSILEDIEGGIYTDGYLKLVELAIVLTTALDISENAA